MASEKKYGQILNLEMAVVLDNYLHVATGRIKT